MDSDRVVFFDQIELISDKETVSPSQSPVVIPTVTPTLFPSEQPVVIVPTSLPSVSPTKLTVPPTSLPSTYPSHSPTLMPSMTPTFLPSNQPVVIVPTSPPSALPSKTLTASPSSSPSTSQSSTPSRFPSINPTSAPQGPDSCVPPCVKVYDEILDSSWTAEYSFKCNYNLAFQKVSKHGSNSIKVAYRRYGALYLKHSGLSTTNLHFIQFWMKGKEKGYDVRVKINGVRYTIQTTKKWTLVKIPLTEFSNPQMIQKIYFQSASKEKRTIFFDEILLL